MGYQFIHLETYSRKADSAGRSTAFVFDEADRKPEACRHVALPMLPTLVFGAPIEGVRLQHDARAAVATTEAAGKMRRIRTDQHTLATVVASYPVPWDAVRADPVEESALAAWQNRTVDWLRAQFGDQLTTVVRHDDERFPHLHAYIVPADPSMRAKALHPGWAAKTVAVAAAKADGANGKEANARGDAAYKAAMRTWQDSYWEMVGLPCGLTRLGPARRRLTRSAWQAEQAAVRTAATLMRRANQARRAVQDADADVRVRLQTASHREAEAIATTEKARAIVDEAKARLLEAQRASAEADAHRRRVEAGVRQKARNILEHARAKGARTLADAEAKAASMRRVGGWLGSIWAGFRQVEQRLTATADARVLAAKKAVTVELEHAKENLRAEIRRGVSRELLELRQAAQQAEKARQVAEERLSRLQTQARQQADEFGEAKAGLVAERAARQTAEADRDRFRSLWADADNELIAMRRRPSMSP